MQAYSLLISDLHLDPSRDTIVDLFASFLKSQCQQAQALYILGDLFEAWVGDDDLSDFNLHIINLIAALADYNTHVYFMAGNRDFLIGQEFSKRAYCTLLDDPTLRPMYGHSYLLMHGDTLCTQDTAYQVYREQVRDPQWQQGFLSKSLSERQAFAKQLREQSKQETQQKETTIMDVDQNTVVETLAHYDCDYLIHGHTHRLATHNHQVKDKKIQRWVLGDWYESGSCIRVDDQGPQFISVA